MADEFQRIDTYCDTVPRAAARTEQIGAFTLFVDRPGRSFYARPTAESATTRSIPPERDDFHRVLARQRILRQPQSFEWIHEIHPALAAGRGVELCFLSTGSTEIARVYAGVGFARIGTSCIAEPAEPDG